MRRSRILHSKGHALRHSLGHSIGHKKCIPFKSTGQKVSFKTTSTRAFLGVLELKLQNKDHALRHSLEYSLRHSIGHVTCLSLKSTGQQLSFKTTWVFLGVLQPKLQNCNSFIKNPSRAIYAISRFGEKYRFGSLERRIPPWGQYWGCYWDHMKRGKLDFLKQS